MIFKTKSKVQLKKPYWKILYLYPALNDTFVFLGMLGLKQDCITHVNAKGQVLFQHTFPKPMDAAGMMNNKEIILLETRSKWYLGPDDAPEEGPCITILDLQTHEFRRTPHYFINEQTDQSHIVCFGESKFLCIREDGRYNDNRFKLSYYHYPPRQSDKPFHVYSAKDNQWTYEYLVRKANQHSMMAWFKIRHDTDWEFKTYDLRDQPRGRLSIYKFKNQIGIPYKMEKVQVAMSNMWEMTKNVFMLVCTTNKTQNERNKQLGVVQNNFVCDTKNGTVRQAKFQFGQLHDLLIDQTNLGNGYCMFRTFDFKDGRMLQTPIYYVSNQTQRIVAQQKWQCSYLHKVEANGLYGGGVLVNNQYENGDVTEFVCESLKIMDPKQVSLFFLMEMNTDKSNKFHPELIEEVMGLLHPESTDIVEIKLEASSAASQSRGSKRGRSRSKTT